MKYYILNGLVYAEKQLIHPIQLFKIGRLQAEFCNKIQDFIISKRVAEVNFKINSELNIEIFFKGEKLNPTQINSSINYGYFISNQNRIHYISDKIKKYIETTKHTSHLPDLIKIANNLYYDGFLETNPSNIINNLVNKDKKEANSSSLFERELYPYQSSGVEWLSFCTSRGIGTILADDMGLGKTAQVIALCCNVLENMSGEGKILIVVPNPLLDNWIREFHFFAPKLKPYLHYGPNREGLSSLLEKNQIILTPYTTLCSDISMLEEMTFDLVLYDEASNLKNPHSARSLAARRLNTSTSVAITGTPVENSLLDAWSLSDLVFPGYLGQEKDFKSRYIHSNLSETLKCDLRALENSLSQITLRRMKKDVLTQLPSKIDIKRAITLNDFERRAYSVIINEMQHDIDNGGSSILPLINKLQQFTAHPALLEPSISSELNSLIAHSSKFELLMMELDSIVILEEKVIIFVTFQKAIDLIKHAIYEKFSIHPGVIDGRTPNAERQPLIDKFSTSIGFDILLLHPRTAGVGLNITAAKHVIHYCRQWNPALEAQATARAWRNGQISKVSVYYFYYANTIEEMINERLMQKQQLSDQTIATTENKESDKELILKYLEFRKNNQSWI